MQIIVTLLLCGIACCLAAPPCSKEEFEKCSRYAPFGKDDSTVYNEDDLNAFCKFMDCQLDFHDRCGDVVGPSMPEMTKMTRIVRDKVCDKQNPLRYKFLNNSVCLNRLAKNIDKICKAPELPLNFNRKDPYYCEQISQFMKCYGDAVEYECGRDARDAFEELVPGLDFYGC